MDGLVFELVTYGMSHSDMDASAVSLERAAAHPGSMPYAVKLVQKAQLTCPAPLVWIRPCSDLCLATSRLRVGMGAP